MQLQLVIQLEDGKWAILYALPGLCKNKESWVSGCLSVRALLPPPTGSAGGLPCISTMSVERTHCCKMKSVFRETKDQTSHVLPCHAQGRNPSVLPQDHRTFGFVAVGPRCVCVRLKHVALHLCSFMVLQTGTTSRSRGLLRSIRLRLLCVGLCWYQLTRFVFLCHISFRGFPSLSCPLSLLPWHFFPMTSILVLVATAKLVPSQLPTMSRVVFFCCGAFSEWRGVGHSSGEQSKKGVRCTVGFAPPGAYVCKSVTVHFHAIKQDSYKFILRVRLIIWHRNNDT